jgi:hypothetical protein
MGIRKLIQLIINYEKTRAKELKKHSRKQFKSHKGDTHCDNVNVAFEHFGTVEDSEESKE